MVPPRRWRLVGLGSVLAVGVSAWLLRKPLVAVGLHAWVLRSPTAPASVLEETLADHPSPVSAIVGAWNTDRIVHREVAMRRIGRAMPKNRALPQALEALLVAGAQDPDQNVREASFGALSAWSHPALASLAILQLSDADPENRRQGLQVLRRHPTPAATKPVARLLDDPEPDIAASAVNTLGRVVGRDFGIKLADAVAVEDARTGLREFKPESYEKVRGAAAVAKAWLVENPPGPADAPPVEPLSGGTAPRRLRAPDFELRALDGTDWRLSRHRGRVVLIQFWTTWCTACVGEIPALIRLRSAHAKDLEIVGVSLDALADAHGHVGGHDHESGHEGDAHEAEGDGVSLDAIRRKVKATVERRGINYPVLLDVQNEVGIRYNGGELPTTVIVDREGYVHRRFVGPRSLQVLEAMVREAERQR